MFEFIRKHLKLVMIIFFPLVIFAFVFVGIDASLLTQRSPVVARVGSVDITQAQWDMAHRQMADRARLNNPGISSALLDSPSQKYTVLEQLVRDEVYRAALQDKKYTVSDAQLARTLQTDPNISTLRKPDGSLDMDAYRNFVAASYGMTPESFENSMRYQLGLQQVIGSVQDASISTDAQASSSIDAAYQKRSVQLAEFLPASYEKEVHITDAQLETFYQQNTANFQQPEQVDIQYVLLDLNSVMDSIDISDADLRSYYESNKEAYTRSPEQRQTRHILINATASMSDAEREAARKKANDLLEQIRQSPNSFASLAASNSEDPGSKDKGGDLGLIRRGDMVPAFDEVVFRLNKNEISDVVATEYGFHIIQVTDIKPADVPSFEEVRSRLAQDAKNSQARSQFVSAADTLRNVAHEQPDSLEPAAQELKLKIQTAKSLTRTGNPEVPTVLNNTELLEELFSSKLLDDKYNSDAVDVGNNQIVVARIDAHRTARVLPLAEVRDAARQLLLKQESARLAKQAGEAALQNWQAKPTEAKTLKDAITLSRQEMNGLDADVVRQIMAAPTNALPQFKGFDQGSKGYLIARINKVLPLNAGEASANQEQALFAQMRTADYQQVLALAEAQAYYEALKQQYKAQIRVQRP